MRETFYYYKGILGQKAFIKACIKVCSIDFALFSLKKKKKKYTFFPFKGKCYKL